MPESISANSSTPARHGDMDWLAAQPERRIDPRVLWGGVRSIIMLGVNYGPDENPLAMLATAHARRDFGLCAGRRLSRRHQEAAEDAGALAGGRDRRRGEGVRRHRRRDGKAAGAGRGTRLAGQAHQSGVARVRLVAVSRRDLFTLPICRAMRPTPIIAAPATPARRSARPQRSPRPTSSMRGAASPISRSRTRARSRTNSARAIGNRIYGCDDCLAVCPWNKFAQAGREAKLAARAELRAPSLAELARLDDAAFRALFAKSPVKRIGRDRFVRNVLIAIGNSGDAIAGRRGRTPAGRCKPAGARRCGMGAVAVDGAGRFDALAAKAMAARRMTTCARSGDWRCAARPSS